MGFKLGDISPVAGVLSGKGLMGKLAGSGGMGLLPAMIARNAQGRTEDEERAVAEAAAAGRAQEQQAMRKQADMATLRSQGANVPMKKGGSVSSASKRADGIAQRGKTRA